MKANSLIFISIILLFLLDIAFFTYTIDDAFISFQYAKNLANGNGLTFNAGEKPFEGYSNFLWIVLLSAAKLAGMDILLASKIFGTAFSIIGLFLTYKIADKVLQNKLYASLSALILSAVPAYAYWAVSGLETIMFTTILLLSVYLFISKRYFLSSLSFVALALIRPEGMLIAMFTMGYFIVSNIIDLFCKNEKKDIIEKKNLLLLALPFAVIFSAYLVWKLFYFGDILPNTFYLKSGGLLNLRGGYNLFSLVSYAAGLFILTIFGLKNIDSDKKFLMILTAVLFAITLFFNPMQGIPFRFLIPAIPFIAILASGGLKNVQKFLDSKVLMFAIIVLVLASTLFVAKQYKDYVDYYQIGYEKYVSLAYWMRDNLNRNASFVFSDIGAVTYFSGLRLIDNAGITNRNNNPKIDYSDWILDRKPDLIILITNNKDNFENIFVTIWDYNNYKIYKNQIFQKSYERVKTVERDSNYWLWVYKRK